MFNPNIKWRYLRRPNKIINFCKHYKLEDNLEILSFNIKWSDHKLRKYLSKRYNITSNFLRAINERIYDNSNIIIVVYGTPNSGKSEGAQMIAFFMRYVFWKYMNKRIKMFTAFSTSDFQTILTEMKIGDIGIRDESPDESGMGSKNVQKYLNNITRIIRQNQNSFVFLDPTLIKLKVASFYLETAGKNKITRKIRFILYDKDHKPMGHIYLPLHWCGLFRKKYKEKKTANINSVMANAGMVTPEINPKRIDRDEKRLLAHCIKVGVSKKGEIRGQLDRYNRQFKRPEDKIKGDTNYMDILVSNVWHDLNKFNNGLKEIEIEKHRETQRNIKYIKGDSFPIFVRNNLPNDEKARVGFGLASGHTEDRILDNNPDIKGRLDSIKMRLRYTGGINERLCFLFEKWFALEKGVPIDKLDDLVGGTSSKPDLIWKGIIYSIKYRIDGKSKSISFHQSKKGEGLRPEYIEALKRNTTYKLVFMNPKWSLDAPIIDVDPQGNDKVVVYKPK